jgi:uncharacterized protein YqeY
MSLINQIDQDIKQAMLAKEADRLRGLRAVKAALLLAKTEKGAGEELTEDAEIKVLQKLIKNGRSRPKFTRRKTAKTFILLRRRKCR